MFEANVIASDAFDAGFVTSRATRFAIVACSKEETGSRSAKKLFLPVFKRIGGFVNLHLRCRSLQF